MYFVCKKLLLHMYHLLPTVLDIIKYHLYIIEMYLTSMIKFGLLTPCL